MGDAGWRRLLLEHNQAMRGQLDRYRGREVGTTGDGFLALFDGAVRAARCARSMITAVGDLGIRSAPGSTPARSSSPAGRRAGSRSTPLRGWRPWPSRAKSWSARPRVTCSTDSGLAFAGRGDHQLKGLSGARTVYALEGSGPAPR